MDMLSWELPKPTAPKPIRADKCPLSPGVLDPLGNETYYPSRMWVDDALIASVGVFGMKMALAAVIEAIFAVMGKPDTTLRQCPVAMDKWQNLVEAVHQLALGLIVKSRCLTVAITKEYVDSTLQIITTVWPGPSLTSSGRKRFTAIEASKLVGKLGRLTEGAPWTRSMVSHLYTSIAFALAQNKHTMSHSSPQFKKLLTTVGSKILIQA